MDWRRLGFYLLINVAVSALVATGAFVALRRIFPPPAASSPLPVASPEAGATPGPTQAPVLDLSRLPTITPTIYVVRSGDTLLDVALEFDIAVEDLMAANGLTDPDVLEVGQALVIPLGGPNVVTPAPGERGLASSPFPTATSAPVSGAPDLIIQHVASAGDLQNEAVRIANRGGAADLAGWALEDSQGNRYVFPALTLHTNGAVTVHTRSGQNTVIDLYWGASAAVWQAGETLTLRQPDNAVHTTFTVR